MRAIEAIILASALLLTGCSVSQSEAQALLTQSTEVTFSSVIGLGPHRLEATRVLQRGPDATRQLESMEIAWADADNFLVRQIRDGEVRREVRVLRGQAWVRSGERFKKREDAELYRGELAQTWNFWGLTLDPFSEHVAFDYDDEVVIEGRRAHRFTLRQATEEELDEAQNAREEGPIWRRTARFIPVELSGSMVLDETTSVRLIGEFEGRLVARDGSREQVIRYREVRSGIGERPVIPPPRGNK